MLHLQARQAAGDGAAKSSQPSPTSLRNGTALTQAAITALRGAGPCFQEAQGDNTCAMHASNALLNGLEPATENEYLAALRRYRGLAENAKTSPVAESHELVLFHNERVAALTQRYGSAGIDALHILRPVDANTIHDVVDHPENFANELQQVFAEAPLDMHQFMAMHATIDAAALQAEYEAMAPDRKTDATPNRDRLTQVESKLQKRIHHFVTIAWRPEGPNGHGTWRKIDSENANLGTASRSDFDDATQPILSAGPRNLDTAKAAVYALIGRPAPTAGATAVAPAADAMKQVDIFLPRAR
jgi:hypothetical protein